MKNISLCIVFLLLIFITDRFFAVESIKVAVPEVNANLYKKFIQDKGVGPNDIQDLKSEYSSRIVADIVIISQALKLGGMDVEIEVFVVPNSARERAEAKRGNVVMAGQGHWEDNFDDSVYMTSVVIPDGGFEKGIYCLETNAKLLAIKTLQELQDFIAISIPTWFVDWSTLEQMPLKGLIRTNTKEQIYDLLGKGKVDFTLLEFPPNKDLSIMRYGVKLIPVSGVKVGLKGTRHYMVSKKHPAGEKVFKALDKGIKILKDRGTIQRYYEESGFYQKRFKDWKKLN